MAVDVVKPSQPRLGLVVAGLVLLTAAAYGHVLGNGFVNYDDPTYVTANENIRRPFNAASVRWAMTAMAAHNWHPLIWMSLQLDYRLFGLRPWGCHLTNLLLHLGSTLLLFGALRQMTGAVWRSALAAALFAVHPLHVESVAWVAERKDVLSGFFWMLTLAAYAGYAHAPSKGRYLLVAATFALGLMAKPMVVTLPCVLLLLDYWPLRRMEIAKCKLQNANWQFAFCNLHFAIRLLLEKVPLFLLAAGACVLTWCAQQAGGAIGSLEEYPLSVRVENVLVSYVGYLRMAVWPSGLAPFYPHPGSSLPWWQPVGAGLLLAVITTLAVAWRRRLPYLLIGWLWYLGTLVPVIGLVQVGQQAMADRYSYLPLVGLFIAFAWGLADLVAHRPALRQVGLGCAVAAVATCAVCTWLQVRYWKSSMALWRHAFEVTADNYVARNNLGLAHLEENSNPAAAEEHLRVALAMKPGYLQGFINLAAALDKQDKREKTEEAIIYYRKALEIEPDLPVTRTNLGVALAKTGKLDEAIEQLTEAVRLAPPDFPEARDKLERALDAKRRARPAGQ